MKTCLDCIHGCLTADNETCERFKDKALFEQSFRYRIFQAGAICKLEDARPIGAANSFQEACKIIKDYLAVNNFYQDPYWRFIMDSSATFIDYGSYSQFMAIVPPVSHQEMMGENKED